MIKIENVSKTYLGKQEKALADINLTINKGEVFGLVGPNGAGKSTLIKLIVGMLNLDEGDIKVNGHSIKSETVTAKMSIGFVSDNHSIYDKLSGMEFLLFVANIYEVSSEVAKAEIERLVELFELQNAINDSISSYSHGMRQKICIIASLLHSPKVWVLDEPLTGLDPKGTYNLKQIIKRESEKGTTVVFSSHLLEMVEKLCDRIAIIDKGKVVAMGKIDDIKANSNENLESIFLSITSNKDNQNENQELTESNKKVNANE
ncbi:MAG: ABC transporter ATP-binding protein [Clostridia bacterium]|nr:ABC transporter ATP-binding protein [Clostridia bacterium]